MAIPDTLPWSTSGSEFSMVHLRALVWFGSDLHSLFSWVCPEVPCESWIVFTSPDSSSWKTFFIQKDLRMRTNFCIVEHKGANCLRGYSTCIETGFLWASEKLHLWLLGFCGFAQYFYAKAGKAVCMYSTGLIELVEELLEICEY